MEVLEDSSKLLGTIATTDPLASENLKAVKEVFLNAPGSYEVREYVKGDTIVQEGHLTDAKMDGEEYGYATVPLGLVVKGSITVLRGDKGVKKLEVGDFVGLFETGDWLVNGRTRQIGDWTLIAENNVSILFLGVSALDASTATGESFRQYLSSLARTDRVPKPISTLPLLDWVASHTTETRLSDCAIIAHTHIFPSSVPLFRHLAHLVGLGNIFVLDKPYSTVRSSLNELIRSGVEVVPLTIETAAPYEFSLKKGVDLLWQRVIEAQKKRGFKKLLIIDDGGDIWLSIPWADLEGVEIAGVEQTQRGITRIEGTSFRKPPIVSVASSGVKKIVEASFIGAAVVAKLESQGALDRATSIGILGTGSIGAAIKQSLEKLGKEALSYDNSVHKTPSELTSVRNSTDALMREADLIIGTTGGDSFSGVFLDRVQGVKTLASASSSDIEFQTLLKLTPFSKDPFQTVRVPIHEGLEVDILNGGFPVNFDREKEWEPAADIVLTRCLLYIGIMQAAKILTEESQASGIYTLDQTAQEKTLTHWIADKQLAGEGVSPEYLDVQKVVSATFLEGAKVMPTVWKD
jgi:hypothetical protein